MLGQDVSRESVKYRCDRVSEGGEELLCKSQYGVICTSGCEVVVQKEIVRIKKYTLRTTFPPLKTIFLYHIAANCHDTDL